MKKIILSVLVMVAFGVSAQTKSAKDEKFAKEVAEAGMLEVKLGQLASTNAKSEDVKMLGQQMVTDHTKGNNELMALAKTKSISLPTTLSAEGQKHYDDLSKKTGADFDKAYSALMVKDHEKVVSKFKSESSSGEDMDIKNWATNTLPTLEHHLMMSKETEKKVNGK